MDETKRHLYRIDSLKVQQKIFDLYPAGSEARRLIIKDQKMQEYQKLSRTLSSFPVVVAQETLRNSKRIIGFGLLRVFGGVGFTYLVSTLLGPSSTVVQMGIIVGLSGLGFLYSFVNLIQIFMALYSMKMFNDSVKGLEERLSKLKKDIFS